MRITEFSIMQNESIGAHAIWEFTRFYDRYSIDHQHPKLLLSLPVLPMVFNYQVVDRIKDRRFKEGSLYRVISEDRSIYGGLQERMEAMYKLTLRSINFAHGAGLILYDPETSELVNNRSGDLSIQVNREYQDILKASRRIGAWFAQLSLPEILMYFSLKF